MIRVAAFSPVGVAVVGMLAAQRIGGEDALPGAAFAGLGGALLLALLAALAAAARHRDAATWADAAVGGLAAWGAAVGLFAAGWAAERQNYWDAVHFAVLAWAAAGGGVTAFAAAVAAARAGSRLGAWLLAPGAAATAALGVLWASTAVPALRELQARLLAALWAATHG